MTSITQTEEGYILTDETGREWKVLSGLNSESRRGMYRIVKEKLRCSVSPDLLKLVSKETARELELTVCPGSDGKEWE